MKSLLSVLTDAKNRMIVVKDKKGRIQGAAVMKLLVEQKSQKPLIFLDKIYPVRPSSEISEMILETARKKSKVMGFDLYQKSEGRKTQAPTLLIFRVRILLGILRWGRRHHQGRRLYN